MLSLVATVLALTTLSCRRSPPKSEIAPANLLLVTLDTVRADHVGAYGERSEATPNLDRLAREGVRFARAWSTVPLTLPSHASILTGLLPPRHGLRNNGVGSLPEDIPTLATHLRGAGLRTGAFIGAFVLDRRWGLSRGFDTYDDEISLEARSKAGLDAERPGREVVDHAVAWLDQQSNRPFFAWVHLYDPHAPYEPPEPYRTRFAGRPYLGEIAAADHEIGRLLAELERLGLLNDTVVAVAGDHGEALGEHDELTHGLLLYEGSLRVPMVLYRPGLLPEGWTVEEPVSLVDLGPTVAALLGHPIAATGATRLDGRDLAARLRKRREPDAVDLYAESRYPATFGWSPLAALRRGGLKFVAAPRAELYDLAQDPAEKRNLLERRPDLASQFTPALAKLAAGSTEAAAVELDSEARAKLASLGYIAGTSDAPSSSGAPRDPKDMVSLFRRFEEAHWALVEGRLEEAARSLDELAASDPRNPVFRSQLAEASRRRGALDRAIALYQEAIALAPDDREARYNLAVTLQEAGRSADAVVALTTAITLDPGRPEAHNALGIALSARGDLEGARREFARTVELDARNERAYNNLGNVLRDLGKLTEAEAAYRRAIELAPNYPDPLNGLGALDVQRDRPAEAIPYFERAIALAPDQHEARLNRAIALQMAGQRDQAIQAYRDFIERTRRDPQYTSQRDVARQLLARLQNASANAAEAHRGGE